MITETPFSCPPIRTSIQAHSTSCEFTDRNELGLVRHEDDRWAGFALNDPVWWERAVPIEGRAGDAVIFHTCTIHGSPDNRSDRPRPVFIQRYRRADDFCVIDVANVADRERAEQAPITAKTEDDWGLMVRGIRRYQPAKR